MLNGYLWKIFISVNVAVVQIYNAEIQMRFRIEVRDSCVQAFRVYFDVQFYAKLISFLDENPRPSYLPHKSVEVGVMGRVKLPKID
jgi:hypothetical protein